MDQPTFVARLEHFLRARLPDGAMPRVVSLERSTEGFSQETFSFEVVFNREFAIGVGHVVADA
jgi:hypothetical protein